jgi:hypothetical protein
MQLTFTGNNTLFLEQSFFDQEGALAIEVTSVSPTEVVLSHTVYTEANVSVTFRGTNFALNEAGLFTSGTITSIEFDGLDTAQGTISDISWSALQVQNALVDVAQTSDFNGLADLFNSSGPITIDAEEALTGFDQEVTWAELLPLITQPITFVGSSFDDAVEGTSADDTINTGTNVRNGDRIVASEGDDRIIFDAPDDEPAAGYILDYGSIGAPVTFNIDATSDTATVDGPGFTDTFENVAGALQSFLGLQGTENGDTYDIALQPDQVVSLNGRDGADNYTVAAEGAVPIFDFRSPNATSGVDITLQTGEIANDGFGFAETFEITGTPDRTVFLATNTADEFSDGPGNQYVELSDGDDVFVADTSGEDSIDGGAGADRVVFADTQQGQMTLAFQGAVTFASDRSAEENRTAMFSVETLETQGGVELQLARHDGIGQISAENLTTLTELYIAYFDRAADALGLSFWATVFEKDGLSFEEIADEFFTQPETVALYSDVSDSEFVTEVYQNVFGRGPDDDGLDFWTGQLAAGEVTESGFILDFLAGARADTGSPDDVAYIENKTDIGLYFAVVQGQNNLDAANSVMDEFDGSAASLQDAISLADSAYTTALDSSTDLLMPVIGVVDTPFGDIA